MMLCLPSNWENNQNVRKLFNRWMGGIGRMCYEILLIGAISKLSMINY